MLMNVESALVRVGKTTGYVTVESLEESLDVNMQEFLGFLKGRMTKQKVKAGDKPQFEIDGLGESANFAEAVKMWLQEIRTPVVRTPLTRENLLAWAVGQVKANPTRKRQVWDAEQKKHVDVDDPNTTALVLADILHSNACLSIQEEKASDLFDTLQSLFWEGTKGFKDYTVDEALDEIEDGLMDPDNSPFEFDDLEDLLERFGPDGE